MSNSNSRFDVEVVREDFPIFKRMLDMDGIAIRAGHHCAQPVMQYYRVSATARASLSIYNTKEELDTLAKSLNKLREKFI